MINLLSDISKDLKGGRFSGKWETIGEIYSAAGNGNVLVDHPFDNRKAVIPWILSRTTMAVVATVLENWLDQLEIVVDLGEEAVLLLLRRASDNLLCR